MKVLIVTSGNTGQLAPFVKEQIDALSKLNVDFDYYFIIGKGILGYLLNFKQLKFKIDSYKPDIIHAHYGLSGLLALMAKKGYPLVTTFHGNDINPIPAKYILKLNFNKFLSRIASFFSNYSIFVNFNMAFQAKAKSGKYAIIPCQVNLDIFYPIAREEARMKCKLLPDKKYVLFSSAFDNSIKNYPLANAACKTLKGVELVELKGFTRKEVNLLLNACDLALITSFNEGSPQFFKEAMACNCPIVSTDVGDVRWVMGNIVGCFISKYEPSDVAEKITLALEFGSEQRRTNGRNRILELGLDSETISKRILMVYKSVLN